MDEMGTTGTGRSPARTMARPPRLLPASHLLRISAYWLGLTAIDSAAQHRGPEPDQLRPGADARRADDRHDHRPRRARRRPSSRSSSSRPSAASATSPSHAGGGASRTSSSGPCSTYCTSSGSPTPTRCSRSPRSWRCSLSTNIARAVPSGLRARSRRRETGRPGQRARRADADPRQRDRRPAARPFAIQAGNLPIALVAVAVVELVTMASVVLRVGNGLPPRAARGQVVGADRPRDVGDRHPSGTLLAVAARLAVPVPDCRRDPAQPGRAIPLAGNGLPQGTRPPAHSGRCRSWSSSRSSS